VISAIVLIIDFALGWAGPTRWLDFGLLAVAAVLSILNVFIHTRDHWTSVVPGGLTVSTIVAILLAIVGLRGWRVAAFRFINRKDVE
jgi:uncharacterized membrane protein